MTSVITLFDVMLNNMIFFVLKDFDLSLEPLRVVLAMRAKRVEEKFCNCACVKKFLPLKRGSSRSIFSASRSPAFF